MAKLDLFFSDLERESPASVADTLATVFREIPFYQVRWAAEVAVSDWKGHKSAKETFDPELAKKDIAWHVFRDLLSKSPAPAAVSIVLRVVGRGKEARAKAEASYKIEAPAKALDAMVTIMVGWSPLAASA